MIFIYTDQHNSEMEKAISSVEGLTDAVEIKSLVEVEERHNHILIHGGQIIIPIPWDSTEPPVLFEPTSYSTNDLLAVLLSKLGYEKEALRFCESDRLKEALNCRLQLTQMDDLVPGLTFNHEHYVSTHNHAVLTHYAGHLHNGVAAEKVYEKAISQAPSGEQAAFSAKHLAIFLMDSGLLSEAEQLLRNYQKEVFSERAEAYLRLDLINILIALRSVQYDKNSATEIKELISASLAYFEKQGVQWVLANLLMQASEIANFEKSYSESLGYISKAIIIYEEEEFPEFLATAYIRKGTLLYTWAQDQNPQFFQSSIDTYQKALETFRKEAFPDVYAEIHHNLAVIYAEMPVDEKKKGMWSAFSATSFKECLEYYQKDTHPFEYAMVSNNYASALLKYPPAKTGDNAEKAIYYYLEALEIRDAQQFPIERAHTILNYLEACWRVQNVNKTMERARYKDMLAKAKEIKQLTEDPQLIADAQAHLDQISSLGLAIMKD